MEAKLPSGMTLLLIEALGGKEKAEEAMRQIVRTKCRAAIGKPGATIGDAYDLAMKEGWVGEFLSLTITDFAASPDKVPCLKKKRHSGLGTSILDYVAAHPGATTREIRKSTGASSGSICSTIVRARKQGKIVSHGAKPNMTYYLPTDVPKLA